MKLREYIFGCHVGDGRWLGLRGHICGCGDIHKQSHCTDDTCRPKMRYKSGVCTIVISMNGTFNFTTGSDVLG